MRDIFLYGDIHGSFKYFEEQLNRNKGLGIQLGDLGIGFRQEIINPAFFYDNTQPYKIPTLTNFECSREKMVFLKGNHDFPEMCRSHPNYLGEFGIFKGMFFVSGAWSIDKEFRKEGVDWWPDEELSISQGYDALELYDKTKPDIVLTHECPLDILSYVHHNIIPTRTGQLLNEMYHIHHPKHWYFAHHHVSFEKILFGTHFKCLNVGEYIKI